MHRLRPSLFALGVLVLLVVGCRADVDPASSPRRMDPGALAPRLTGLGDLHVPITTSNDDAQAFFDQGMVLAYGFNHAEAGRAFREAARLDPACAMCYWGAAYVLGPNINAPMDSSAVRPAQEAIRNALDRADAVTPRERAYIGAMAVRYGVRRAPAAAAATPTNSMTSEASPSREALDVAYADAMREVARRFPTDPDAQTLFAESLMDTTPWDYWTPEGAPRAVTTELLTALETALATDSLHPGANHFYIHAVESAMPERGVRAAENLDGRVPNAGHLVHMPGHIYIRVGRYHDAVRVNVASSAADSAYIAQCGAQGFYPLVYYPHNLHFLWFAAMMGGEGDVAVDAATRIAQELTEDMVEVERLRPVVPFTLVRFGRWDDVFALDPPSGEHRYATAMWHYARGLALLHTAGPEDAMVQAIALAQIDEDPATQELEQPFFFGASQIRIARRLLDGQIASAANRHDDAVADLQDAVTVQDALPYMEPPYWYYPTRQTLGTALLKAGRPAEAEAIFRADLAYFAENGWSLHGLVESLHAQGKSAEAHRTEARFETAWQHADVVL